MRRIVLREEPSVSVKVEDSPESSGPTWAIEDRDGHGRIAQPADARPALTVLDGPRLGECHRLEPEDRAIVIGRGTKAQFVLPHPTVSKLHARVFAVRDGEAERVKIVDMGSRNGTYLNGEKVDEALLEPGDRILVGEVLLRFDWVDPIEARFLSTVASKLAQAERDGLTGLFRRSVLNELGDRTVSRCQARQEPCAILMIDLDHFKRLNDTHGHQAGDEALRTAAQAVLRSVRERDVAVRYGGEEFVVILANTSREKAVEVSRRISAALKGSKVPGLSETVTMTASQGLAMCGVAETLEDAVRRADRALLKAKRDGRDRLETAPES